MSQGKVYLVGAGPGDAELITLKGYRLICHADVILHDHLIPYELLHLAKPTAEIISVGKFASRHTMPQEQINALLIEKAKNNIVVRLKGGDSFVFGRGGEETEACADAGIDFEIVPGVTSALAAPAYVGIPPTHRDYTSNVAIVTAHRKEEGDIQIPNAGTIIFLMGVSNIKKIIDALIKAGWAKNAKIAAIERGTCYDQRVITGTLNDIIEKIQMEKLQPPAVFIVGQVVELHEKLGWFRKKPAVLVLGMHPEKYRHLGNIVHRQIIDSVPLEAYAKVDEVLKKLDSFDWAVFTSVNGVKFFFEKLNAIGSDTRTLASTKVAAIGKTTAEKLAEFGILADLCPQIESSAGLVEEFKKVDIKNRKILLPRAQAVSTELADGLARSGAAVKEVVIYKTVEVDPGEINFEYIDQILFTSGSTIRAFVKRFGPVPSHIKVYCLGSLSLAEAKKHNINAEVLS